MTVVSGLGFSPAEYEQVLLCAGFQLAESKSVSHIRYTLTGPGYEDAISVDFSRLDPSSSTVSYCDAIKIGHRGILTFQKEENVVVLCCVSEMLRRGYTPRCIELEKTFPLGHRDSGRLDIMVYQETDDGGKRSWVMIECKTWSEYAEALNKITRNEKGQLLSYFVQDPSAQFLYLYSCRLTDSRLESKAEFIDADNLAKGVDVNAIHASWDKTFGQDGLFHPQAAIYSSAERLLLSRDLWELDRSTGAGLFNRFAEALRQHSISDKSNAFNKLFNLFVCKIVDEDNHADDDNTLDFQAPRGTSPAMLLATLDELYRAGLDKYLHVSLDPKYAHPIQQFAFLDVYDEHTLEKNYQLLSEVVRLFQHYRLKYTTRQQHLGDFFEKLLHNSVRQEAGQFFTPVPLATFAVKALPMGEIVTTALKRGGDQIFPHILDYACGSGHFLTEAMLLTQQLLDGVAADGIKNGRDRNIFAQSRSNYAWAKNNVYGLEVDYRLAKVTKINTFLNGDGEATILHADGLAPFSDPAYKGLLSNQAASTENRVFDVLVANPPYAISNFLEHSPAKAPGLFELRELIRYQGDEIECLFVERAAQILRTGGVAAVILPAGLFSNVSASYDGTRRLLLRKFKLRGAVSFGDRAFAATGVQTIMVFLERRDDSVWEGLPTSGFHDYDHALTPDQNRLRRLCEDERTVLSATGKGQTENDFLGYKFSNRRGQEGIQDYGVRSLYCDNAADAEPYLADLIQANFNGEDVAGLLNRDATGLAPWLQSIYNNTKIVPTGSLLRFDSTGTTIELSQHGNELRDEIVVANALSYPYLSLGELAAKGWIEIRTGKRPTGGVGRIKGGALSLGGEHLEERTGRVTLKKAKFVPLDFYNSRPLAHVVPSDTLICKDGALSGKVAYVSDDLTQDAMVNEHVFIVRVSEKGRPYLDPRYLFCVLFSKEGWTALRASVRGSAQTGISADRLSGVSIPIPDLATQEAIKAQVGADPEKGFHLPDLAAPESLAEAVA